MTDAKTIKELAAAIGRSRTYVHAAKSAMLSQGIPWPMGMMSLTLFREWVAANDFRCTSYARGSRRP